MLEFKQCLRGYYLVLLIILGLNGLSESYAGSKIEGLIRDVEIEETLSFYLRPLSRVAGFDTMPLKPYVIASPELNASATLNATIFVHTGLILESASLEALLGVLAHELGHIQCGHLARRVEALQHVQYGMISSILLGALAGVGTGRGDVGASLAMGGMQLAQNRFMMYSQGEESAADQAAIDYCTALNWPLKGLEDFLSVLLSRQRVRDDEMKGVLTTHPPTQDRVGHIHHAVQRQQQVQKTSTLDPIFYQRYQRMVAKLRGFLTSPGYVLRATESSSSFDDLYARSIALFRLGRIKESIKLIDDLLAQEPKNPFLYEVKGQFLLEEGKIKESIACYAQAVNLHPAGLLKIEHAQALLASENDAAISQVQKLLEEAQKTEREILFLWQGLSIVYGKQGKMGLCQWALAEKALLMHDYAGAERCAQKAKKLLPLHSREALRADDILQGLKSSQKTTSTRRS